MQNKIYCCLPNTGNTCYLNASIQAILNSQAFTKWLCSDDAKGCNLKHSLFMLYNALNNNKEIKNKYLNFLSECNQRIEIMLNEPGQQHDAAEEFLTQL